MLKEKTALSGGPVKNNRKICASLFKVNAAVKIMHCNLVAAEQPRASTDVGRRIFRMNIIAQRFGLNLLAALRFVYAILAAASQNKTDDAKYYHCDADPLRS